jgi:DNA-binding transcriptional MerR regulator
VLEATLTIGDLVERTGVGEGTLRMWERRHGFPAPERLPSGHRRYRATDAELVLQVLRERAAGLSLPAAIARAREAGDGAEPSVFAGLRRRRPELQPIRLRKPLMLALTRAIEDESCARAERALLFGAFQRERFYRQS